MKLDITILDDFKRITGKDISGYIDDSEVFFRSDYNTIVDYYSGNIKSISSIPFANFESLKNKNKEILFAFKDHAKQFNNLKWWLLIEQVEEIDNRLKTLSKINKWARSSLTSVSYNPSFQVEYVLKQNQTLEDIALLAGSNNPQDDWVQLAEANYLREEDYSSEGGNKIDVNMAISGYSFKINSVVDVIKGKSIYGKDIYRKIQFEDNDLKVLSYEDTILQAVGILVNLRKNSNPDDPNNGLQTNVVAGSNKAIMNFPVIMRQLNQTFSSDDTLKNFNINNISISEDNLSLDFTVQTRLNEVIENGQFQ